MDAGQLKGYTNMMIVRSYATVAGHQGMLIITGYWNDKDVMLSTTELLIAIMASGVYVQWYTTAILLAAISDS